MEISTNYIPVALFVYNRPIHLEKTISYLRSNFGASETVLYIFSDGSKNEEDKNQVEKVRELILNITEFKKIFIHENEINKGLAKNIIDGINLVFENYDEIIVLEDDLITSPYFLQYMNEALQMYKSNESVCQVVGYSYFEKYIKEFDLQETFFVRGADCLGWGTWKRSWKDFHEDSAHLYKQIVSQKLQKDFNRNNTYDYISLLRIQFQNFKTSWAINWYAICFLNNKYTLYPSKSLVYHIGNDTQASNYKNAKMLSDPLDIPLNMTDKINVTLIEDVNENFKVKKAYNLFLKEFKNPPLNISNFIIRGINKLFR